MPMRGSTKSGMFSPQNRPTQSQRGGICAIKGFKQVLPDSEYDAEQLALGVKVEMEHTDNPEMAKCITKHHLAEIPNYYTYLIKMEEQARKEQSLEM